MGFLVRVFIMDLKIRVATTESVVATRYEVY